MKSLLTANSARSSSLFEARSRPHALGHAQLEGQARLIPGPNTLCAHDGRFAHVPPCSLSACVQDKRGVTTRCAVSRRVCTHRSQRRLGLAWTAPRRVYAVGAIQQRIHYPLLLPRLGISVPGTRVGSPPTPGNPRARAVLTDASSLFFRTLVRSAADTAKNRREQQRTESSLAAADLQPRNASERYLWAMIDS